MKTRQNNMPLRQSEPTTLASWALGIVEALERSGFRREDVLSQIGLSPTVFQTPNLRLGLSQLGKLWDLAVERFGERAGLEVGKNLHISHWQTLGVGLASSLDSGEWLARLTEYSGLLSNGLDIGLEVNSDQSIALSLRFKAEVSHEAVRIDCILKAALGMIHHLFGIDMRPFLKMELMRCKPADPQPWFDSFGSEITWSCKETRVFAAPEVQRIVIATTDPELSQSHDTLLHRAMVRMEQSTLEQEVSQHILNGLSSGKASLQQVARSMNTSSRSLQRRLEANGHSFSGLKDKTRLEHARLLLEQGINIAQITQRLGYTEVTNFHAAFKRLSGQSTGQYLESLNRSKSVKI